MRFDRWALHDIATIASRSWMINSIDKAQADALLSLIRECRDRTFEIRPADDTSYHYAVISSDTIEDASDRADAVARARRMRRAGRAHIIRYEVIDGECG